MSTFSRRALFWTPRILFHRFIAFVSLFALDVFSEGLGFWQTAQALMLHLIPSFVHRGAGSRLAVGVDWNSALWRRRLLYIWWVVSMSRPVPPAIRLIWALTIAAPALVIAGLSWLTG